MDANASETDSSFASRLASNEGAVAAHGTRANGQGELFALSDKDVNAPHQKFIHSLSELAQEEWDRLSGPDDPFSEYAFLECLEASGSLDEESGWKPSHLIMREEEQLVAAAPLYLKEHSYGEYIFDFAWADAAYRAGIEYYPKLVSMAPFTPATGTRLLARSDASLRVLRDALLEAANELQCSSLHMNFLSEHERDLLIEDPRFLRRETLQFHFTNPGYGSFDDFLGELRSSARKQIRRERREADALGLEIELLEGEAISREDLLAMGTLYQLTCLRKGSYPYLKPRFFELAYERLRHRILLGVARHQGEIVAAAISFKKGENLYGRYWGAREELPNLHFELCYYRLIEYAIAHDLERVEAGAQGPHKIKRGFLPVAIHSAHAFTHPGLHAGIAEYLERERRANRHQIEAAMRHSPFRQGTAHSIK